MLLTVFFILYPTISLAQVNVINDTMSSTSAPSKLLVSENKSGIACMAKKCVHKCCPEGKYIKTDEFMESKTCVASNTSLDFSDITLYDRNEHDKITDKTFGDTFSVFPNRFSKIDFKNKSFPFSTLYEMYLSEDGRVYISLPNKYLRWQIIETDKYCIDFTDYGSENLKLDYWVIDDGDTKEERDNIYYTAAMCVSSIFLILVLIVYCVLSELRTLGGKILMAYVFSQLLAFISLAVIRVNTYEDDTCLNLTATIYFFFLASCCWMNVMSYDIFWTFRGYAKPRQIHRRGENFKFIMYSLYAWGVPLAMAIILVVISKADLSHIPWFITPQIPQTGCFLMDGQKFVYLYIPMLILIICNCFFFLLTVFNIWRLGRGTSVLRSSAAGNATAHRAQKNRFMLYLKLSIIMGVNWVLEVVSFFYPNLKIWWISDLYNLFIGLAIFIIFVFKRKVYKNLKTKWSGFQSSISKNNTNSKLESELNQSIPLQNPKHIDGPV